MAEKRVFYVSASLLTAYRVRRGHVEVEARFSENEEGLAAYAVYLKELPRAALIHVLADVVEEDFQQDTIPFVRGADRRALLERRLAQRYRDPSLSLVQSLGTEKTQRRNETVLISSLTNPATLQPWLAALREAGLAVVGVFAVGQLAPRIAKSAGQKQNPALLVTLNAAGLRQSYVEPARLRFSRLSPFASGDLGAPERLAMAFHRETGRLYQYLVSSRAMAVEGEVLDVVLISPPDLAAQLRATTPEIPSLSVRVLELAEAMRAVGIHVHPPDCGAEVLYVYSVATAKPREQYAREALRGRYRIHQVRTAIFAGGAAVFAACLAAGGVDLLGVFQVRKAVEQDQQQLAAMNGQYARITARFPPMPTTTESLRVAVLQYDQLAKQTTRPEAMLAEVSQALQASPRIELEDVKWERIDVLPAGSTPSRKLAGGGPFELVQLTGHVLAARASEYRNITTLVNEFIESLRRQPGLEVVGSRLPFDVGSQTSLSGDIGTERAELPTFTVTVARRIPG